MCIRDSVGRRSLSIGALRDSAITATRLGARLLAAALTTSSIWAGERVMEIDRGEGSLMGRIVAEADDCLQGLFLISAHSNRAGGP